MKIMTVDELLKKEIQRLIFSAIGCLTFLSMGLGLFFSYQSQKQACDILTLVTEKQSAPLAREIFLGQKDIARAIFSTMQASIDKSIHWQTLSLNLSPSTALPASACIPGLFESSVQLPIIFSGQMVALIEGTIIQSFGVILFILLTLLSLLCLLSFLILQKRLLKKITTRLLQPLYSLSQGQNIQDVDQPLIEVKKISENFQTLNKEKIEIEQLRKYQSLSRQVAHDLKSPLAALVSSLQDSSYSDRISGKALERIREITQNLLDDSHEGMTSNNSTLVIAAIEDLLVEKKLEYQKYPHIYFETHFPTIYLNIRSPIDGAGFKRALSNLINNAIEAYKDNHGTVRIEVGCNSTHITLSVIDYGIGIPELYLEKILKLGMSIGKIHGQGLGLKQVQEFVSQNAGELLVTSSPQGTKIVMKFLVSFNSTLLPKSFRIEEKHHIAIIDDDSLVHQFWKSLNLRGKINFYFSPEEFLLETGIPFDYIFCDYHFRNSDLNGIRLLENSPGKFNFLVTNEYEDPNVMGFNIIPKNLLSYLDFAPQDKSPKTVVLVDDEPLMHLTWSKKCQDKGHRFIGFTDITTFKTSNWRDLPTGAFIFFDLLEEQSILENIGLDLIENGQKNIFLASGHILDLEKTVFRDNIGKSYPDYLL